MTRDERRQKRYAVVFNATQDTALARKARDWSQDRIYQELRLRVPRGEVVKDERYKSARAREIRSKSYQWGAWSSAEKYPTDIKRKARDINRRRGFDKDARFGWATMYYAYTQGRDVRSVIQNMQVDKHYKGEAYEAKASLTKARR